jgi:hypothetical protein
MSLTERQEVFRALVELQDRGVGVVQSRKVIARRFGLEPYLLAEIEEEGLEEDWPLDG